MKRILAGLTAALLLSGCTPWTGSEAPKKEQLSEIASAGTVYDIFPYMTMTQKEPIYSECRDDKELYPYFDLLEKDEYIIVEHGGEKYLLLWFTYMGGSKRLIGLDDIRREYSGEEGRTLTMAGDLVIMYGENRGGGASAYVSKVRCIVKLEHDVDRVFIEDSEYRPYDGGMFVVGTNLGVADEQLNLLIPPCCQSFSDLRSSGVDIALTDLGGDYYRYEKNGRCGVMDAHYRVIIGTQYRDVFYYDRGSRRFFVVTDTEGRNAVFNCDGSQHTEFEDKTADETAEGYAP